VKAKKTRPSFTSVFCLHSDVSDFRNKSSENTKTVTRGGHHIFIPLLGNSQTAPYAKCIDLFAMSIKKKVAKKGYSML